MVRLSLKSGISKHKRYEATAAPVALPDPNRTVTQFISPGRSILLETLLLQRRPPRKLG